MNTPSSEVMTPKAMPIERGAGWLLEGFNYFKKSALSWIGTVILLIIISAAMSIVPLIGGLALNLLMPVFMAGLILGCQAQAGGGEFTVNHLFAGFSKNTAQLVVLGVFYLLGMIIITVVVIGIALTLSGGMAILENLQSGDPEVIMQHLRLVLLIFLVASALYIPLLMAFWFAPALVILNDVPPVAALKLSFMACLVNILPFLLYGIVGLVLSIIAAIPFGLGFLILFPMVVASVYIAWSEIFENG